MDELRTLTRGCFEYRESCIMHFTETWLHPEIPDGLVEIEGFSHIRSDRTVLSGKSKGGGLCLYINDRWCRQHTVREKICSSDVELLCVSLRPFYLPREFGNILICSVYVPPVMITYNIYIVLRETGQFSSKGIINDFIGNLNRLTVSRRFTEQAV